MRSLLVVMDQKLLGHLLHLLQGPGPMDLHAPMRHSSGEIAPPRRSTRDDAVGSALCPTPTHQRNRTKAEGKSRPEALPTKRGSLSKVSMPGKPCRQKNWTTTSKRASASKSPRTSRCNQIEVPASTKLAISTTCCRLPSGSAGTRLSSSGRTGLPPLVDEVLMVWACGDGPVGYNPPAAGSSKWGSASVAGAPRQL